MHRGRQPLIVFCKVLHFGRGAREGRVTLYTNFHRIVVRRRTKAFNDVVEVLKSWRRAQKYVVTYFVEFF